MCPSLISDAHEVELVCNWVQVQISLFALLRRPSDSTAAKGELLQFAARRALGGSNRSLLFNSLQESPILPPKPLTLESHFTLKLTKSFHLRRAETHRRH